jgi:hypothetical protein
MVEKIDEAKNDQIRSGTGHISVAHCWKLEDLRIPDQKES